MKNDFKNSGKVEADVFVTHTHWDHIMGFPMFAPIYTPGTVLRINGPVSFENETLETIIKTQLSYRYWPVRIDEAATKIDFIQLKETTLDLGGGLSVTSKFLNHPGLCLGYRFDYQGKSIAAVFDHEPYYNIFHGDPSKKDYDENAAKEGKLVTDEENEKLVRFIRGADIVIHDTQYTNEEYPTHIGWGHACHDHAVDYAVKADVKKLVFFHYDPVHTDKQLKQIEKKYAKKSPVKVMMSKEGMTLEA
jgi:ribonuclease BN (tRNA processing enzyme)